MGWEKEELPFGSVLVLRAPGARACLPSEGRSAPCLGTGPIAVTPQLPGGHIGVGERS